MRRSVHLAMLTAALSAASACPSSPPGHGEPAELSLQIATRQSCGALSGLDYDTACLAAVDVTALDADTHVPIFEECHPLGTASLHLRDILGTDPPLITFAKLSTNRKVILQVHGIHDLAPTAADPCGYPALDPTHWLFWGESDVVNLADYASADGGPSPIIRIVVDCRDCTYTSGCAAGTCFGCGGMGDQCPAEFPTSLCVPAVACAKACNSDDDCFDRARGCVNHVCDTSTITGELCSPCGGAGAGCGDGLLCVSRVGGTGFCAPQCPIPDCATGTKCNRLGNDLVLVN